MPKIVGFVALTSIVTICAFYGQALAQKKPGNPFVVVNERVVAIVHVSVIDGTGAAPSPDRTVIVRDGRIESVQPSSASAAPANAHVIDGTGKTLIPGLVGMHEHLFFPAPEPSTSYLALPYSFPRLYLASGVTTARTTGSMEPYTDLNLKAAIDSGKTPGPKLELTGPYINGKGTIIAQMHELKDADEAREFVRYWHSVGFTSMKAYAQITPDELRAAIDESHKLGMKITGHLCSVSFTEAAEMGIDNLEHGPFGAPASELSSKRNGSTCGAAELRAIDEDLDSNVSPNGPEAQKVIATLVQHHVALTSTLAVLESPARPGYLDAYYLRLEALMAPESFARVLEAAAYDGTRGKPLPKFLEKEMVFERAFVKAGGMLMAGCDPTGDGHTLAGVGDQREFELLVEGGFTVPEAVRIYTLNGAEFLGKDKEIGSIAQGKKADLVLLSGSLEKDPTVIEKPEIVFKDGIGYDSQKIYDNLRGSVGIR